MFNTFNPYLLSFSNKKEQVVYKEYPHLNGRGIPARKNRAKGNRAIVTRMVDRSHGTSDMLNERLG